MSESENIHAEQPAENISEATMPQQENILPRTEANSFETSTNDQIQTAAMEVHHHTHPGHHKKKWTDYFREFLMLFLAVFCGFLAEYQLEHKIQKDKELQFIKSLASDLQDDINGLEAMISFKSLAIRQLDTLMYFLNDPVLAKQNGDQLYYVGRMGPRAQPFANNSRTYLCPNGSHMAMYDDQQNYFKRLVGFLKDVEENKFVAYKK
ncbi:hypothetical protein [Ferruginibacter sp.]|uniref:hypothetical protein n=1 Tax=Ferruginibacter sp. TaxID=1940288 RepID=UPI0019A9E331|nr:hypothetical protein [Ferruginibacter sp.]MBC7627528.1 hypothetical protein [Ferruginibacter sp.]